MRNVRNDKSAYGDHSQKVYEKKHYVVLKVGSGKKAGYIVYNTNKEWKDGHTHLESFNMAKTIVDNMLKHKRPKTKNTYLLQSHIRLSDDEAYSEFIEGLLESRKSNR